MRTLFNLLPGLLTLLLAFACRTERSATNLVPTTPGLATATPALPHDTLSKRRLFGLLPPKPAPPVVTVPAGTAVSVGKKSTVIVQSGTGNNAAAPAKNSGPTGVGDNASANDNTKAGQKGGAAATGAGSSVTVTPPPPNNWWKWLLVGLGGGLLGGITLTCWAVPKLADTKFGAKLVAKYAMGCLALIMLGSCTVQHLPGPRELQTSHSPHPVEKHRMSKPMRAALRK